MMLGHDAIKANVSTGRIKVEPYDESMVGPNSIDVHLGSELKRIRPNRWIDGLGVIDPRLPQEFTVHKIPDDGLILCPGELWLGHTVEIAGSECFVPKYDGRSSIGRMGLFSHISAGFGDVGFCAQWTLELTCIEPVIVYAGMRIGQVYFEEVTDCNHLYGKQHKASYAKQTGAQESKVYGGLKKCNQIGNLECYLLHNGYCFSDKGCPVKIGL